MASEIHKVCMEGKTVPKSFESSITGLEISHLIKRWA